MGQRTILDQASTRLVGRYGIKVETRRFSIHYAEMSIVRHVKVKGEKSPFDGDWVYWSTRLGRDPTKPGQVIRLLRQQQGRCGGCGYL